ncbi:hypothetical protein [Amycolatopsis minnesotensis]|uniref:Recombination endonuclease VII n=1 Tax=Amycolatopsis minnesotensis TaxID=337894 RepID=A0ABP5CVJ6_9PSEU
MAKLSDEEKARRAMQRRRRDALRAEQDAVRFEERHREWAVNGMRLSLEEVEAGVACRGCGLAISDGLGDWGPLLGMSAEERAEYEAADVEYRRRHGGCDAHRWGVQGSRVTHCGYCCPPLPMTDRHRQEVVAFLRRLSPPRPEDLDTWRLTFTCGHVVERTQHRSHCSWTGSTATCVECDRTRGVVMTEKLPASEVRWRAEQGRLSRELEKAVQDRDRAQKKVDAAVRRVAKLHRELDGLSAPGAVE